MAISNGKNKQKHSVHSIILQEKNSMQEMQQNYIYLIITDFFKVSISKLCLIKAKLGCDVFYI